MKDEALRLLERAAHQHSGPAEVYQKSSETRQWNYSPSTGFLDGRRSVAGLALRLIDGTRTRFAAAPVGDPIWSGALPSPRAGQSEGTPIELPGPIRLDQKVAVPTELHDNHTPLLRAIEREVIRLSGGSVRLLGIELAETAWRARIVNSRGLDVSSSGHTHHLVVRLTGEHEGRRISAVQVEGGTSLPSPTTVAGRAVDRVLYPLRGRSLPERKGELLLDPAVATSILSGIVELFLAGRRPTGWPQGVVGRDGRWASPVLTIVDDGSYPDGPAPRVIDGEGSRQRRRVLLEAGVPAEILTDSASARLAHLPLTGNAVRESYRQLPQVGSTQCWIEPNHAVSAAELLADIKTGYYLLSTAGHGEFDVAEDRFSLPVNGVFLQKGRARHPIRPALLAGKISDLVRSVRATAGDLTFHRRDGWFGSPTLLLSGFRLS